MMRFSETGFAGLTVIETPSVADHRGSFTRWFCTKQLAPILNGRTLAQINHSQSLQAGTVRGLHFQKPPHAEMKIIRCVRGRVVDVALDIRAGSRTFLKYFIKELTPSSNLMIAVPEGFAHGYQALEPDSEIVYFNTAFYEPSMEGAVNPKDPSANVDWPLPVTNLSPRDEATPFLPADFKGISL